MTPMIKPLTWMTVGPNKLQSNEWPFYTINKLHGGWACGERFYGHDGPELAQAAAQADYAARITAALDPAWLARIKALVTAANGLAEAVQAEITAMQLYENTMTDRAGAHGPKGLAFADWQRAIAKLFTALTTFRAAKDAAK